MNQGDKKDTMVHSVQRESEEETHPGMVFKVAGEHARELSEWSKRSFESRKPFGHASPRF